MNKPDTSRRMEVPSLLRGATIALLPFLSGCDADSSGDVLPVFIAASAEVPIAQTCAVTKDYKGEVIDLDCEAERVRIKVSDTICNQIPIGIGVYRCDDSNEIEAYRLTPYTGGELEVELAFTDLDLAPIPMLDIAGDPYEAHLYNQSHFSDYPHAKTDDPHPSQLFFPTPE